MIGEKIKELRLENKMTQKALADKLFVTAQAVSRWENGEVEPSISTVILLAQIFGVSTDEIVGIEKSKGEEDVSEPDEPERQPIAGCSRCHKNIYEKSDMIKVRGGEYSGIKCKKCADEILEELIKSFDANVLKQRKEKMEFYRSFALTFLLAAVAVGGILWAISKEWQLGLLFGGICYVIVSWVFTYLLSNTFIMRITKMICNFWEILLGGKEKYNAAARFFVITLPGGIFKIISFPISLIFYLIVSVVIFPYALVKGYINVYGYYLFEEFWDKNYKYGEDTVTRARENPEIYLNNPFLLF